MIQISNVPGQAESSTSTEAPSSLWQEMRASLGRAVRAASTFALGDPIMRGLDSEALRGFFADFERRSADQGFAVKDVERTVIELAGQYFPELMIDREKGIDLVKCLMDKVKPVIHI